MTAPTATGQRVKRRAHVDKPRAAIGKVVAMLAKGRVEVSWPTMDRAHKAESLVVVDAEGKPVAPVDPILAALTHDAGGRNPRTEWRGDPGLPLEQPTPGLVVTPRMLEAAHAILAAPLGDVDAVKAWAAWGDRNLSHAPGAYDDVPGVGPEPPSSAQVEAGRVVELDAGPSDVDVPHLMAGQLPPGSMDRPMCLAGQRAHELAVLADDAAWLAAPLSPAEAASIAASEDGTDPLVPWPDEAEQVAIADWIPTDDTPGMAALMDAIEHPRAPWDAGGPAGAWRAPPTPYELAVAPGCADEPRATPPARVLVTLRWVEQDGRRARQRQQVRLGTVVERGPEVVIVDVPGCGVLRCWPSDVEDVMTETRRTH